MSNLIDEIQANDPSFDPRISGARKAGISPETLRAAEDRVYMDGYYGPFSDLEWDDTDGRKPSSVKEALAILEKVADNVEDYRQYELGDGYVIDSRDIVKAMWPWLVEIYGGLPF